MKTKDMIARMKLNTTKNQPYFKSSVAFFFLFFLHGTSIGNGQQGVSYKSFICEVRPLQIVSLWSYQTSPSVSL
jgi:hypothetical protein